MSRIPGYAHPPLHSFPLGHLPPQGHFLLFSNRHLQSDNVGKACRLAAPSCLNAHKHTRKASPSSFTLLVRSTFSHQPMLAWLLRTPAFDSAYARKKTPDASLHPALCRLKISFSVYGLTALWGTGYFPAPPWGTGPGTAAASPSGTHTPALQ